MERLIVSGYQAFTSVRARKESLPKSSNPHITRRDLGNLFHEVRA